MKLEEMAAFFDARVEGYDEHMLSEIEGAGEFYRETALLLPAFSGAKLLDIGCGTGLELDEYFKLCPDAQVTGIDLSEKMLSKLREKHGDKNLTLINDSYFTCALPQNFFDGAVSVESLHHFKPERKLPLYERVYASLKAGGAYVETDYCAPNDDIEKEFMDEGDRLRLEQGISEDAFFHYDTPLTKEHTSALLARAGFRSVRAVKAYANTVILLAVK